ncbi:long-chain fatty acid--CoA ligase, partial [Candidatus Pacearchaeota archaeon]|nr:long-chain fatty acid--CoA ligase [Candidatus Pacearchaeota archaeon]
LLQYPDYFELGHEKTLRCIGSASAPHPVDLIKSFEERFGVYVLQGYGLTEATCGITLNPLNRKERKLGSVGKPLSVNQVKVLSDDDEVLPPGQSGRIFVYGDNIASFDDNSRSFESEAPPPSDRALETGDIGYVDEDGFVWLQSRSSDLIKRGGYRMSTVEIEAAILEANPNAEVAVIGVPHPVLGQDVIAFVVKRETDCKARDIIRSIKSKIASYKIPSEIVFIESLPMIGVGKVDKKTLLQSFMKDTKNRD